MNYPSLRDMREAILGRRDWAVDVLSGWVKCQSTLGNEMGAQTYIEQVYKDLGLNVRQEPVALSAIENLSGYSPFLIPYEDRPNIVGIHTPSVPAGHSVVINGHVDVVSPEPVSLWTISPFEPYIFEDEKGETWMMGRGAGDMKGGSVSALWAFEALRQMGLEPAGMVVFQSCIEEECTGNGTLSLLANGGVADACLIPEPFNQTILAEQAGVLWFEIHVSGKTTHVLGAGQGVNAIEKAWTIYHHLQQELEAPMNAPENLPKTYQSIEHPANLNLGVIQGGDWPSTVAGECTMRLRMGLLPGTSCSEVKASVREIVARACDEDPWLALNPPEVVFKGFQAEPCAFDTQSEFAKVLMSCHEEICGEPPLELRATCTTDVRFFNLYAGIPATCYGPKAVNIHGADERVSIDSMENLALVIARFLAHWCGVSTRSETA